MPDSGMTPLTSVFRVSGSRKIKRNRQALSCIACQKRKSRCDRRQPCGACEKRGDEGGCCFGPVVKGGPGAGVSSRSELQSRLTKLEELVKGLAEQPMSGPGPWPNGQNQSAANVNGIASDGQRAFNYSGPTSWSALVESIRDIQSVLEAEDDAESLGPSIAYTSDMIFGDVAPITMDEILGTLPPRQDVDKLITAYFNSKFVAIPFIHTCHFKRRYDKFWESPESTNLLWISIMCSIMSCAVLIVKMKGIIMSSPDALADSKTYTHMAIRCLVSGRYFLAKPMSVEAVVMLAHSCNIQQQDSDTGIWTLYALGIRLAQRQGYHRDASKISCKISPFEGEMRRRVWFVLESYDLLFSYQQGVPPMTHEDAADVGQLMVLTDEDFDEDSVELIPRPPVDPLPIVAYATKSRIVPIFRHMLRHALGVKQESLQGVMALGKELDEWYESIPPCLRYRSIRDTSFTDPNYTIFHRIMLELTYHMGRCLLYRSFLLGSFQQEMCHIALEVCRDSALKMLDIHFQVDREIQPGGRLHEDRFTVSNLTLHGFLVAAMIICLELNDYDNMRPEDRKRRIDVLRTAHQMWVARSSTSADARHASKILRAILNRVGHPGSGSSGGHAQAPSTPEAANITNLRYAKKHADVPTDMEIPQAETGEYSVNLDGLLPLDQLFSEHERLDWDSIDRYLRQDQDVTFPDMAG